MMEGKKLKKKIDGKKIKEKYWKKKRWIKKRNDEGNKEKAGEMKKRQGKREEKKNGRKKIGVLGPPTIDLKTLLINHSTTLLHAFLYGNVAFLFSPPGVPFKKKLW